MPSIQATITAHNEEKIQLSALRSGGCANCAQKQGCAILWQPTNAEHDIEFPAQITQSVGQQVTLDCEERALLRYIALLFLPSLFLLLLATLTIDALALELGAINRALLNGCVPMVMGYRISRAWLAKQEQQLLSATTFKH